MGKNGIALCLSGGGLRATLFHLGVIRALRSSAFNGAPALPQVSDIYSVSGGSIIAAHMRLRWADYSGPEEEPFEEAQKQLLDFAQRNIRDRVLRRSILSFLPLKLWNLVSSRHVSGRTHWLMREYEALFGKTTISGSCAPDAEGPTLHILSTNFRTGELCSFSGNQFEVERRGQPAGSEPLRTPCGHLTLSRAVAASSAFPPMFPPLALDDDMLSNPREDEFWNPLLLSDGGVFDNLGIEKFWHQRKRAKDPPGTLIVSHAGSPFRADAAKTYAGPMSRNVRASDILMHRVGDHAERAIGRSIRTKDIVVRLDHIVKGGSLHETVQQPLRLVRTDLDRFEPDLAELLVEHGKEVARETLTGAAWSWTGPPPSAASSPEVETRNQRIASRGADRSFRSLAFDYRDPLPLLLLWALFVLAIWSGYALWSGYSTAKEAERQRDRDLQQQRLESLRAQEDKLAEATAALRRNDIPALRTILQAGLVQTQESEEEAVRALNPGASITAPAAAIEIPVQAVAFRQPVYIQFAGVIRREQITDLNRRLRDNGWNVQGPSGERTSAAAGTHQVRYSGANRIAAEQLAAAITASGISREQVTAVPVDIIGPNNLEVWISR